MTIPEIRNEVYENEILTFFNGTESRKSILWNTLKNSQPNGYAKFSKSERYIIDVFKKVQNLIYCIEEMRLIEILIATYTEEGPLKGYNIYESNFQYYNLKNAVSRVITFRDQLLHLSNALFEFNIDPWHITDIRLKKNKKPKMRIALESLNPKFLELFDAYDMQLSDFKTFRNKIAHEGDLSYEVLTKSSIMDHLLRTFPPNDDFWRKKGSPKLTEVFKCKEYYKLMILENIQDQRDCMEISLINFTKMTATYVKMRWLKYARNERDS